MGYAVATLQRPVACLVTIWLAPNKSISQLMDFISLHFKESRIKAGIKNGTQQYRSRGRPVVVWVREFKEFSAPDCYSDTGEHFHVAIAYPSNTSTPAFIRATFEAAMAKGIVAERSDSNRCPFFITGNHKLYNPDGLQAAQQHITRYLSKPQTKRVSKERRMFGGTRLKETKK